MFSQKTFIAIIVTAGTIISSPIATAQTTPAPFGGRGNIEDQSVYNPPEAYVLKADGTVQDDGTVQGSITFWNKSNEILGDMTYVIELLGELPPATLESPIVEDAAPVYDIFSSPDRFVLVGGEKKTISYTYNPPKNIPEGNYRVEITVANGRGRTLGWYDIPVHFSEKNTSFAELRPGDISIAEYGDATFTAESGPNSAPGSTLTIAAASLSQTPRTAIPVLDIHPFSTSRPLLRTIQGSRIILPEKKATSLSLNVPTAQEPGVYIGMLSLKDAATNERISNLIKYRWVVRGPGADILHVRMKSYGYKKDDAMSFAIDYVGSGDAETKTTGIISMELRDSKGSLGSIQDPNTELSDKILTGEAKIYLPRNLSGEPVLDIKITQKDGTLLASHSVKYPFTEEQLSTLEMKKLVSHILLYGGAALTLIGALVIGKNLLRKNRKHRKK